MKKEKILTTIGVSTLAIVVLLVVIVALFSTEQSILPDTIDQDYAELVSDDNTLPNKEMESFCVDADGTEGRTSYAVINGIEQRCSMGYTYYDDGTSLEIGTETHAYDWSLSYGCCLHKYDGSEEAPFGDNMMRLNKDTKDDWYGFGFDSDSWPVNPGEVWEYWMYVKELEHSGDSRACSVRIIFDNGESEETSSGDLSVGDGGWAKVTATALVPEGATKAGAQIWCPSGGVYDYLIDGQYFGKSSFCQPGEVRQCGKTDVGACQYGTEECTQDGAWAECKNAVYPQAEVNDGKDNNCNGVVDDGFDDPGDDPGDGDDDSGLTRTQAIAGGAIVLVLAGLYLNSKNS